MKRMIVDGEDRRLQRDHPGQDTQKAMRKISARARPIWRAPCLLGRQARDDDRNEDDVVDPSTISMTVNVPKAIQTFGSERSSSMGRSGKCKRAAI